MQAAGKCDRIDKKNIDDFYFVLLRIVGYEVKQPGQKIAVKKG
jgi:hypothetical protein